MFSLFKNKEKVYPYYEVRKKNDKTKHKLERGNNKDKSQS